MNNEQNAKRRLPVGTSDFRNLRENGDHYIDKTMSYHDLAGEPERVYHALVLGMLVWLSGRYKIRSNRESGHGRYDLMLTPMDPQRQGIIIEFKRLDDGDGKKGKRRLRRMPWKMPCDRSKTGVMPRNWRRRGYGTF